VEPTRILYPRYAELADSGHYDQVIGGFLDQILRRNIVAFVEQASAATGNPVAEVERVDGNGVRTPLSRELTSGLDTLIVISFDSRRTRHCADADELDALRGFLATPGNLLFVAPHHDVGDAPEAELVDLGRTRGAGRESVRTAPGGGCRRLASADRRRTGRGPLGLLEGVATFKLHPHLPHLERVGDAVAKLDVLARQAVDPSAPPHPFTADGRSTFDAVLQSRPDVFIGDLVIGDATLWSSTAGGVESLKRLWTNLFGRTS
jgi:hypothetical protein